MNIEFRKAQKTDDQDAFDIEYRYDNGEWLKLKYLNEKVATILVDALNNYQSQIKGTSSTNQP